MSELTQERVQELFEYDFETGLLTWKKRKSYCNRAGHSVGPMNNEFLRVNVDKKSYYVHQIIWLLIYGYFPDKIKHINHKRFDNHLLNLKEILQKVKVEKRIKIRKLSSNNSSGVTGVFFDRNAGQWRAQMCIEGKTISLGYFEDLNEAAMAREQAISK